MKTFPYISLFLTLCTLPLLTTASVCQAQGHEPGIDIQQILTNLQDLDHPSIKHLLNNASFFKVSFDNAWFGHKAQVDQGICDVIAAGNKQGLFPRGYTLYHQKSSVATTGTPQVQLMGSNLLLTYFVPHNYLEFTTTVPGNSLGADLDPRFSFTYDVTLNVNIPLSTVARGLQIASATATISNVSRPDSHNLAGDQAENAAWIAKAFGGPDFLALFQKSLDGMQFPLKQQLQQELDPVNTPLQQLAKQGYTVLKARPSDHVNKLILQASVPETPIKLVVSQLNDQVKVDPKYRNLVHTFAKVRFFNADVTGQVAGSASAFTRSIPADVRTVPIHIDIQRDVHTVITGSGASTVIEPQDVPIGVVRSIDLIYDRTTGNITAPGASQLGMAVGVLSDRVDGVAFLATINDNGPKPANHRP